MGEGKEDGAEGSAGVQEKGFLFEDEVDPLE